MFGHVSEVEIFQYLMKRLKVFSPWYVVGVGENLKKERKAESIEAKLKDYGYSEKTAKEILKWYIDDSQTISD